ncbi:hypothetical protein, partial [Mycobacterium tuberculosis]
RGVGERGRQPVGDVDPDAGAGHADVVEGAGEHVLDVRRREVHRQRAGLEPAEVEQAVDERGEVVEGVVGGGEQLAAVVLGEG